MKDPQEVTEALEGLSAREQAHLLRDLRKAGQLSRESAREHVPAVWVNVGAPAGVLPEEDWVRLWQWCGRPLDTPREPVTAWRAAGPGGERGMSWSPNRATAAAFGRGDTRLYRAEIEPAAILGMIGDQELIVEPRMIGPVVEEKVSKAATADRAREQREERRKKEQQVRRRQQRNDAERKRREQARQRQQGARDRARAAERDAERRRRVREDRLAGRDPEWSAAMADGIARVRPTLDRQREKREAEREERRAAREAAYHDRLAAAVVVPPRVSDEEIKARARATVAEIVAAAEARHGIRRTAEEIAAEPVVVPVTEPVEVPTVEEMLRESAERIAAGDPDGPSAEELFARLTARRRAAG
ncbi:hypothetical protein MF406_10735 [Georgenia sp. TF02-10]|uniref:hypothetical protein n=1 Tax=Georgenia sp. TF02-10 TaxID=2917725 RepID=UPI001FA8095D|nr:hypothetical protein [Georgenia sp. TF02-10]UNX53473.1 hypothetical protein MF406_10735 [Georgenia sp. TF02-10]